LVAADLDLALDVLRHLAAKVTFDLEARIDEIAQSHDLVVGEVADARGGVDARRGQRRASERRTDAVDVGQTDLNLLVARKVDTCDTSHASPLSQT